MGIEFFPDKITKIAKN